MNQSPITCRFAGLTPAALNVLSHSRTVPAKTLLSIAPGEVKDSEGSGNPVNCISNPVIRDIFIQALTSIHYLFAETAPEIDVPDPESLKDADVDFVKLAEAYETYEGAGLEPELILAPVNLSLAGWKKLYSNLSVWQDINDPRSPHKLQRDGLLVPEYIEDHYTEIIGDAGLPGDKLVWQAAVIPTGETEGRMPIGQYLTLQAERLYLKKSPLEWADLFRYGDKL
jgi:hypothetical protein